MKKKLLLVLIFIFAFTFLLTSCSQEPVCLDVVDNSEETITNFVKANQSLLTDVANELFALPVYSSFLLNNF